MNTKDFVVLPWGKPGHSVKLKYKNAQELRLEKVQLELENQEMEKKLQEFQSTRSKEKEGGESSGCHWKAGKAGQLGKNLSQRMSQNRGDFTKLSTGKAKVQLLKEQLQEPVRQPLSYKMVNSSGSVKPKIRGKLCGQCENRAALLICLECGEDYCSRCFAKIHQKGALKLHRTTLLQAKSQILSNVLDVAHRFIKDINPDEPKGENHPPKEITKQHTPTSPLLQGSSSELDVSTATTGECTNPRGRLLCEGPFTEDASAQTSPEVLNERRPACPDREENLPAAKPDSLEGCEVQTSLKIWREPLNIEFKEDSISYMEKLWLKKHRRTPQGELRNVLPETSIPQFTNTSEVHCSHENDEDSDVEETRVQCPALFLPVEELSIERPELSVKIVELNDTYEEEYEEQENIVPYKVELPDAGSQQSSAFHDYQNAFLYENDIHKHHVFTKGKTDLLHHLSKLSSYFEDDPKAGTSNIKFGNNVDPDVYSPAAEKLGESRFFEKHFKEKSIDMGSNQQSDNSCMSFESKDSLPSVDLKIPSIKEKLSQDIKESLEFSNLPERPNLEDVKITESPLLLQEIALRSKPVTEKYQGLERFFVSDKNERLNLLPSHSSEFNSSSTRITITGDRDWVPAHSMSVRADDAVAVGVVRGVENPSWRRTRRETARRHRDLQEQIYHFPTLLKETPAVSPSSPPGSALAPSVCKAASEIAEIECIDATDHSEPLLDSVADQLAFSILEKELNVPRKLADLSEKLYSLTSEDSPTFHNNSLNISQTTLDFFKSSRTRGPCGSEELSSSEKDTETRSFLTLSEGGTDQEKEDLLDKQRVVTAPWPKST